MSFQLLRPGQLHLFHTKSTPITLCGTYHLGEDLKVQALKYPHDQRYTCRELDKSQIASLGLSGLFSTSFAYHLQDYGRFSSSWE